MMLMGRVDGKSMSFGWGSILERRCVIAWLLSRRDFIDDGPCEMAATAGGFLGYDSVYPRIRVESPSFPDE
jgi:hypothetical protein